MSLFGKVKGWLGKKRPEPTDRLTRAATSSSTVRTSYDDDIVPPELFHATDPQRAIEYRSSLKLGPKGPL